MCACVCLNAFVPACVLEFVCVCVRSCMREVVLKSTEK